MDVGVEGDIFARTVVTLVGEEAEEFVDEAVVFLHSI